MDEHDEDVVDAASEVGDRDNGRREFLKKAAVVGGLAAYASPALQIIRMPVAGAQVNGSIVDPPPPPPPPPPTCTLTISRAGVSCAQEGIAFYTFVASPSDACSCDNIEWFAYQGGDLVDSLIGPPGQQFVLGIPNFVSDPISVYAECNGARSNTINVVAAQDCPPPGGV